MILLSGSEFFFLIWDNAGLLLRKCNHESLMKEESDRVGIVKIGLLKTELEPPSQRRAIDSY